MTTTPWDDAYEIVRDPSADDALALAVRELATMGHGLEDLALRPDPTYAPAFRTIWQAGAAGIPAEGEQLDLLEPLTRWLVERGRELSARDLARALAQLAAYERSVIEQFAHVDAVLTPGSRRSRARSAGTTPRTASGTSRSRSRTRRTRRSRT